MNSLFDDIRASLQGIWNRRWLALGVAWVVCLVGWVGVAMVPNSYESSARVFVQLYDPLAAQVGIGESDRRHDIDRIRDTLTSSQHLEKVIRSTPLGAKIHTRKQMDSAVQGLGKAIKVVNDQDNLFEITATSASASRSDVENARLSQQIVQKMIEIFRDENLNNNQGQMAETLGFLDQQLAARQKELENAEQSRLAFESKHPELAQGGVSLVQRLEADRAESRNIDSDIVAAQSALASVNGQLGGTPATLAPNVQVQGGRTALQQAMQDLFMMKARGLTDNHPDVIAERNQVAALKAQAQSQNDHGKEPVLGAPNPTYTSLMGLRSDRTAALQALQSRKDSVEKDIAEATAQQMSNPELVSEAQNISRDYDVLKQQYDKLLQDREEMRLKGQVASQNGSMKFQILDPPIVPRSPTAPNRPVLLLVVLLAGLGAGIGVAFAAGELRSTFGTTAKLERVSGLPVLGAISEAVTAAKRSARGRKVRHFVVALAALGGLFALLLAMEFAQRSMVA